MKYSPFDKGNKKIVEIDSPNEPVGVNLLADQDVFDYYILKRDFLRSFETPKDSKAFPTDKDYENGSFIRFFIKKRNDENAQIIEITSDQYSRMNKEKDGIDQNLYNGIEIEWKLVGPKNDIINNDLIVVYGIEDTNERTVYFKNNQMPGLIDKIKNFTEFAKFI